MAWVEMTIHSPPAACGQDHAGSDRSFLRLSSTLSMAALVIRVIFPSDPRRSPLLPPADHKAEGGGSSDRCEGAIFVLTMAAPSGHSSRRLQWPFKGLHESFFLGSTGCCQQLALARLCDVTGRLHWEFRWLSIWPVCIQR
ncbi:hypothetical protein CFC21_111049 [Triticum aestivum]|uniref:Uncharacterized protein n=2 Tax=Triticum aestivum TaxID=4565 RepID=A0A341XUI4_WHEAT|nr:hypothetical protein CFC21_012265 [Triticum aestivum]KAF6996385.1 hypothetical protein CFC21_012729 [Triticum aestivum]KAF7013025.1 hypothetical protein CFC21_027154 [Triticum aestivum]KAF7013645.1 hypothetical protein CFC21_027715 [Triticum aestivum]KAF7013647.1 hypothetical protein CFC21_027717 [Triticum aestivum]